MQTARRYSSKREAILSALRETDTHPSAEWVYSRLKPKHPDLSLGTVYRNLALFRESGEIISVGTVNGQERFDADTRPHAHFICEKCGCVLDMNEQLLPEVPYAKLSAQYGVVPRMHTLTVFGLCSGCTSAAENESVHNSHTGSNIM